MDLRVESGRPRDRAKGCGGSTRKGEILKDIGLGVHNAVKNALYAKTERLKVAQKGML